MKIAVIPARGGSKRIPRKNIRPFLGRPMISWSIKAALQAGCFDLIIVSTDDEEIAEVALADGAKVPFLRPLELSGDYAGTREVVVHAIDWAEAEGLQPAAVCCLYATAPFVQSADLVQGEEALNGAAANCLVFAATSFPYPIQRAIRIDSQGYSTMFFPDECTSRSQDMEPAFHDAGQFYWGRPSAWRDKLDLFENGRPIVLPRWRVQDIDNEEDWRRAELMHQLINAVA
jgi:N-acylneuraminate cytidylyltransferase